MEGRVLDELLLRSRQLYVKLMEFEDLTVQLAEAVERRDEVSVQMLLTMRNEPAHRLQEINQQMRQRLMELPEEDAIRANEILRGAAQQAPEETALCALVAQNRRLLQRCQETDKRVSLSVGGKRSFYNTFR